MKKKYCKMSISAISIENESPILISSGELGARIYLAPSVEAWIDNSPAIDAYIDPNDPDNPIEF